MNRSIVALLLLSVVGCSGQPLPADKVAYAGKWEAAGFDLTITPDGGCSYRRQTGNGSTPHEVDGRWMMTVDGVELTRR